LQPSGIGNLPAIERLFQRPEEAFDLAVHPRTTEGGELLTDAAEVAILPGGIKMIG